MRTKVPRRVQEVQGDQNFIEFCHHNDIDLVLLQSKEVSSQFYKLFACLDQIRKVLKIRRAPFQSSYHAYNINAYVCKRISIKKVT